jgi:hypothetical protein
MSRVRALTSFFLLTLFAATAFAADPPAQPGGTRMAGAGITPRSFTFGELPPRQVGVLAITPKRKPEGEFPEAERVLERLKANPQGPSPEQLRHFTLDSSPLPFQRALRAEADPFAPVAGNGFDGISQGPYIPSEPTVAGGPLNIFSAGNVSVTVTNKDGSNKVETDGATFFGVPVAEGAISDAQCYYDALRGRFVALCFTYGTSPTNYSNFYLAISKTNDARGAWWLYKFDMTKDGATQTTNWSDYQALGVSEDKIAMTAQQFSFAADVYKYPKVRVLDRAAAYAGQTLSYVDFVNFAAPPGGNSSDVFVTKAARNLTAGDNTIHMLNVRTNGGSNVTYRTITGSPSAPVLSAGTRVTVSAYSPPPDAAQPGTTTLVATNDCRPTDFYVRNGVLICSWHTALTLGGSVSGIRLFRLRTSDLAVLTDETYGQSGVFYYYPAVTVDSVGTIFLGFDRSSSNAGDYPSACATGKRRGDASLQASTLLKAGASITSQSRWGDYTGIDNDASASGPGGSVAWYAGQYTKGTNTFGTWINRLTFTYGQFAGSVLDDADGSAATTGDRTGLAGVTVTLLQGATPLATTTTDAAGAWSFGYLESGTYDAVVTLPGGALSVDALAGAGATTQVRVSATDLQAALTNSQTSAGNVFVVSSSRPAPVTTTITPAFKSLGDPAFTMTVNGSGFGAYSVVRLDGADRVTTFVNGGQLTAQVLAADNLAAGAHAITVYNPAPGGGTSNPQSFVVGSTPDTQLPVVTVTSPAGGESWAVGSPHAITWTATDDGVVESVDLAWSSDGGATFANAIAGGLPNTGTYAWTVPLAPTANARVRVTAHDGSGKSAADSSHANFAIAGWTITASAGPHGSISPSGAVVVVDGATPAFTITPAANYHVADVLVNGVSVGAVTNYVFPPVHANQSIAASFALDTYTLAVTASGNGTVTIDPDLGGVYEAGQSVTLTATPGSGWNFSNWSGDASGSTNPLTITMNANKTIQAVFGQHTYTWNATGSAAFGTAANWTPTRTTPATDDVLIFSGGNTVTATGVTSQTIGQLVVSNSTNVSLTATSSATLTIAGLPGTDFDVQAGSTLQMTGGTAVTVALGAAATGTVLGTVNAAGGAHRLVALGANSLVFGTGARMTLGASFSGNIFGTGSGTSALNSVVFQSGSLLAQAAGANPFGANAPNSVVIFQAGSRFRLDGAVTPSFSARTYADFEDNYSGTTNVTGGTAFAVDTIIVTQGTFGLNLAGGGTIRGSLNVRPGATLNFAPASGTPTYVLGGATPQYVNIAGTFSQGVNLTVNVSNPAGVALLSDWTLAGPLTFSGGIVSTGANTLAVTSAGSVTGASQGTGWVAGNLRRNVAGGASTRAFDVGGASVYAPVSVSMTGAVAAFDLTASTASADHPNLGTSDLDASKTVNRWWRLAPAGSPSFTSYDAVFGFDATDVDAGANTAALGVRRYASSAWSTPVTGTRTATSTQATGLTAFGDFALGETASFTIAASAGTGGVISPSGPVSVAYGGNQSFTITANAGWSIADVLVDGGSVGAVGNYGFTNVTGNHTIAAAFADLLPPTVTVTSPNGGESFAVGAGTTLAWSATDLAGVTGVDLLLSRAGAGGPFDTLATAQPNSGTYPWTVTGPATAGAYFKVVAHDVGGNSASDASDAAFTIGTTTGVEDGPVTAFSLSGARPNPMRSAGHFGFALPRAAQVRLSVMDVQGREVLVLADGEYAAGRHAVAWANGQHGRLGSGLYFVRLRADGRTFTQRFVIAQ